MKHLSPLRWALLLTGLLLAGSLPAQVYIAKYAPGATGDRTHRIELFNESVDEPADLSGYFLLTRHFAARIPEGSRLAPLQALRIGQAGSGTLDLDLTSLRERLSFSSDGSVDPGDFVILFDPNLQIVDGCYLSRQAEVDFLPAERRFLGYTFRVPAEQDYRWAPRINNLPDPAMEFLRINGQWVINSRSRTLDHAKATEYRPLQARYVEGIVTVKWKTAYERDCYTHLIERSTDGNAYRPVRQVRARQNQSETTEYIFYDTEVQANRVYYYRISNVDKFGQVVTSTPTKIRTEESKGNFTFDLLPGEGEGQDLLNVRFSSRIRQQVRMQLMDEELREIAVLYFGNIEAEQQNLVSYTHPLPVGKYFVIVSTDESRLYEPFIVD